MFATRTGDLKGQRGVRPTAVPTQARTKARQAKEKYNLWWRAGVKSSTQALSNRKAIAKHIRSQWYKSQQHRVRPQNRSSTLTNIWNAKKHRQASVNDNKVKEIYFFRTFSIVTNKPGKSFYPKNACPGQQDKI